MQNRLIRAVIADPLNVFRIIFWNLKMLLLRLQGKKSIVYNIQMDYFFNIFEPVYEALKTDKRIRIYFACFEGHQNLRSYLQTFLPSEELISSLISPFVYFDLFITSEINGPDFPLSLFNTKRVQTYHGSGVYPLYTKTDVLSRFDTHLAIGPQFVEFIKTLPHSSKNPNNYAITGFPKLDAVFNPSAELVNELTKLYHTQNRFVILYTPHWNPFGSLHVLSLEMITTLAKLDNVTILIKVHNFLFAQYKEDNWQQKLNRLSEDFPNVHFVTRPNTQEIYPLGNMLITDTGTSAAFEFSLTQKPLFVFYNPEWFSHNQHGEVEKDIIDTAICFTDIKGIVRYTRKLQADDPDLLTVIAAQKQKQDQLVKKYLFNPGCATQAAVEVIRKELRLNG
ncbi:MAG: CDP-glycerol glycerophosphotransferase family protein [Candidatus Cloacimonetes bacterium]|nr:CDP-glycerol glycerophosphotransferase family protein [Candidatus Cloacimonadota bacterium]